MTTIQEKKKELTVGRYEFYKTKEVPMTDTAIMKLYGMDNNQLNKWKKENNLVGKDYGLRGKKPGIIKQVTIQDDKEPKLLKENEIDKVRLSRNREEYEANKKLKEKLEIREKDNPIQEVEIKKVEIEQTKPVIDELPETLSSELELIQEIEALKAENERLKTSMTQNLIAETNDAVKAERYRQNELYGHQRHAYGEWLMILTEEVGEVAQAMQGAKGWGKETDAGDLYGELIHVAAVASAIAEQVAEERM